MNIKLNTSGAYLSLLTVAVLSILGIFYVSGLMCDVVHEWAATEQVERIELNKRGHNLVEDGIFGPKTNDALMMELQKDEMD